MTPDRTPADENLTAQEALLIRECIRLTGRSLEPERVIREMLHLLSELLGLNRGRVVMPDAESGQLVIRHTYGLTREEMARGRYAPGEGITGRCMATGETLIVQDIDAEPAYLARAVSRATLPQETVSYIVLPLEIDGRVAGVLGVHRLRQRPRPLAADMAILRTVATLIAQVLKVNRLVAERTAKLEGENRRLREALAQSQALPGGLAAHGIVGTSPVLVRALRQVEQVAGSDATVLLLGESGTGKELFAQALHRMSARAARPFIKINCAAIPDTLFEAELFGHEKGAFTGAQQARPGRFEQADGGTLFLDEIGDLPPNLQVKLLRVLQERVVERVGGRREIPVDVRIVAATHHDLQARVAEGRFRADLFYRLNVIPVHLPALRERSEDIKHLVRHFLEQLNRTHAREVTLTPAALASLVAYPWPGNIRQLVNVMERVVLLAETARVDEDAVEFALVTEAQGQPMEGLLAGAFNEGDGPSTGHTHWRSSRDPSHAPPPGVARSMGAGRINRAQPAAARNLPATVHGAGLSAQAPVMRVREWIPVASADVDSIRHAIASAGGNKSRAAQALGMTLRQLNYRIVKLGLA
jgi:Nif-specific regulatory protein